MPLGLGLGLGIGKGNIYPPASAWPTVADIPPGALVLDSDGVVKEKVGDYLIPVPVTIIGSGPIASAPSANASLNNTMWYDPAYPSDPFVCVGTFNNSGTDYVNCGRPAWIGDLAPNKAFTIKACTRMKKTAAVAQYMLGLVSGDPATLQQISLLFQQVTNSAILRIGGVEKAGGYTLPSVDTDVCIVITSNGALSDLWINGVKIISELVNDSYISTDQLKLCGYSSNAAYNAEAQFFKYQISNQYVSSWGLVDSNIDEYDFNKWDGSASGNSLKGYPFTVTSGTPLTEKGYAWIRKSLLQ